MTTDELLADAKKRLVESRKLLNKYPDRFSLRVSIREWSHRVDELEREREATEND